jgi:class 3 adenylate cyclase
MESTGIPDQIQVTEAFRDQLSKPFNLDFRGELAVRDIGKVSTYFLCDLPEEVVQVRWTLSPIRKQPASR